MDTETEPWSSGRQLLLQRCKSRALACLNDHEYKRAFAHFIVALTVQPSVKGELLNAFLFTLEKLASDLEKESQVNEILMCYQQALDVLPCDSHVLHGLASTLFRLGYVECAASYFLKSYQANPFFSPSLYCMENLKNALVERWHFVMLNDFERNQAYKMAIKKAVEAGFTTVLDIGAGTGIFSMMTLDAGAEKVYACEGSEIMSAVLQSVVEANNKSVQVISKFSTEITIPEVIPEKVSLIVTEIFDAGLFGENSLETLNHAWEHLLQTNNDCETPNSENEESISDLSPSSDASVDMNGENSNMQIKTKPSISKIIPYAATVYAVPLECEHFRKKIRLDNKVLSALSIKDMVVPQFLDEEPYSTDKLNNVPGGYRMLSNPLVLLEANFNSPSDIKSLLQGRTFELNYNCIYDGQLDAIAVWFELHLDDEITISTAPNSSESCCWDQAIFYTFPQNLKGSSFCKAGDNILVQFLCQGHLQLQNIDISNQVDESLSSQNLVMDPALIYLLNSYCSGDIINLNLKDILNMDNSSVLDISTFPVLSLKNLRDSSGVATVLRTQYQNEVEQLQDLYHIPNEKLMFTSYEELYKTKMLCDFLIVDPVELCGLLKKNLLEDIMMLRMRCLKDTGRVVPGEIEISAILVESTSLLEQSRVTSDEKTVGYKVSQIMNAYQFRPIKNLSISRDSIMEKLTWPYLYDICTINFKTNTELFQCRIHQDVQFSTLHHKKLSEPIKLCQINLNNTPEQERKSLFNNTHKTTEVEIINPGKLSAVIYWFNLKYLPQFTVDTSDPNNLWKQAACILDEEMVVTKGEKLHLQWSLKNGCLQIGFFDKDSTVLN